MTINVPLTPDLEVKLRETAAASGKDLTAFVLEAIEEKVSAIGAPTPPNGNLTAEQWSAEWQSWASSHRKLGYIVDDSREGIYSGRGE